MMRNPICTANCRAQSKRVNDDFCAEHARQRCWICGSRSRIAASVYYLGKGMHGELYFCDKGCMDTWKAARDSSGKLATVTAVSEIEGNNDNH